MPAGRPPKLTFDETLITVVKNLAAEGKTMAEIAAILGIAPFTFLKYRERIDELQAAVSEGKSFADDLAEQALFARAIGYYSTETKVFQHKGRIIREKVKVWHPPDVGALKLWLMNRKPDEWREKSDVNVNVEKSLHRRLVDAMQKAKEEE